MTEILNEQICGTAKYSENNLSLICEVRISRSGRIMAILGGTVHYLKNEKETGIYIGAFSASYDGTEENKQSIAINLADSTKLTDVSNAIATMIAEIEVKYS